ncbi:MAG: radical SAM domain-containing protein [Actinomycetota bacterium]|nr:radical SAM domain-containing protein [Actinomycetota bacterium]
MEKSSRTLRTQARWLVGLARATRPIAEETREALALRWSELPSHVRTDAQTLGRMAVGCEGTHGVFPRCNFTCTPCYHSADANRVRVDGAHTVAQVEAQMAHLASVRGPHAHAQLIGGEVSLLDPDDHARALEVMRRFGREPMSFTHGDIDYTYLERLVLGPEGKRRFRRISFAGHFDITMRGRRGLRRPGTEAALNPYRAAFCELFRRLRREHGVRFFLAHNMTVTPANVEEIPGVVSDCRSMGFNMFSFQPAAFVGDARRWKEDYRRLDADEVWGRVEEGAGTRLPYRALQTGDERCNRAAFGYSVGDRWFPLLDDEDPADLAARDAFFRCLGGVHWNAPPILLMVRLARLLARRPRLAAVGLDWLRRHVRAAGGGRVVLVAALRRRIVPMTFVMHRFMHADDVRPAWELLQHGVTSDDPVVRETQERLQACFYAMAHPETGEIVPACVQHSLLDPDENAVLAQLLPLPRRRTAPTGTARR